VDKVNVLIATPGFNMEAAYVKSLTETLVECNKRGITYRWINGSSSTVSTARESTAMGGSKHFNLEHTSPLENQVEYDCIIWIDSDISWTIEQFFALYNSPYEITTGAYYLPNGEVTVYTDTPGLDLPKQSEPLTVDRCGFGFIGMKKGVFERMPRPWFYCLTFVIGEKNGEVAYGNYGEDISWCIRAKEAGFDIWFDPSLFVTHHKLMPLGVR
jgi:hypothetical protein